MNDGTLGNGLLDLTNVTPSCHIIHKNDREGKVVDVDIVVLVALAKTWIDVIVGGSKEEFLELGGQGGIVVQLPLNGFNPMWQAASQSHVSQALQRRNKVFMAREKTLATYSMVLLVTVVQKML